MNRIEKLIKEKCPNGIKYATIEKVISSYSSGLNPRQNFKLNEQDAELYYVTVKEMTTGKIIFSDKTDKITKEAWDKIQNRSKLEINDVLVSGIGTIGKVALVDIPCDNWNCSESVILLKPKFDMIIPKYLVHLLRSNNIQEQWANNSVGSTLKGLRKENVLKTRIPLPSLEVQEEIVRILDKFCELEAELEAELEVRKSQYEFWRGKIISESKGKKGKLIELLSGSITDGPHTTPKLVDEGIPFISATAVHEGKIHLEDSQGFITKEFDEECSKKYKPQKWDVYMVKSGSTTGKVAIVDIDADFNIWSPLAAMRTGNKITSKFLYHLLQTTEVQEQVQNRKSHGSQPNLSMRILEQFDVKIPSLEEQERIVNVLDKFDALVNDITIGLPAEIELRRKQYEYYRNKLLSFEEVDSL